MLRDELVALLASRSVCPAARPTASRPRTLATSGEVRSPSAKSTVTKAASSDEPNGPFSEAAFVTALRLFTVWDIQVATFALEVSASAHEPSRSTMKASASSLEVPGSAINVSASPSEVSKPALDLPLCTRDIQTGHVWDLECDMSSLRGVALFVFHSSLFRSVLNTKAAKNRKEDAGDATRFEFTAEDRSNALRSRYSLCGSNLFSKQKSPMLLHALWRDAMNGFKAAGEMVRVGKPNSKRGFFHQAAGLN